MFMHLSSTRLASSIFQLSSGIGWLIGHACQLGVRLANLVSDQDDIFSHRILGRVRWSFFFLRVSYQLHIPF